MKTRLGIVVAILVMGVLLLVAHAHWNLGEAGWYPGCLFYRLTGFHCAGCGMTRAAYALSQGDLWGAFRMNPLLVAGMPFLAAAVAMETVAWVKGADYQGPRVRVNKWMGWGLLGLILAYWFLRNVPLWPFNLLAPA